MGNSSGNMRNADRKAMLNKQNRLAQRKTAHAAVREANQQRPLKFVIPEIYQECRHRETTASIDRQYDLYRIFCDRTLKVLQEASDLEIMLAEQLQKIIGDHRLSTHVNGDSHCRTLPIGEEDNSGYCRLDHLYGLLDKAM